MVIAQIRRLNFYLRRIAAKEITPRGLIRLLLVVQIGIIIGFYLLPDVEQMTTTLPIAVGMVACLWLTRSEAGFVWAVHGSLLLGGGHVFLTAIQSGGINSSSVIWLVVLPLPALLLLGRAAALFWFLAAMASCGFLYAGSHHGWWSPVVIDLHGQAIVPVIRPWANYVLCVLTLMLTLHTYERQYARQKKSVEIRNRELSSTYKSLEQANMHKEEFIATVSHELRAPMVAILGLNGVLRDQVADRPDDTEFVEHIRLSTEQLLVVINNILEYSQLQAGNFRTTPDWMDLRATLLAVLDSYKVKAKNRRVEVHLQMDEQLSELVRLDRQRLTQVLSNLLDNAIKYSPLEGAVLVAVSWSGDCLHFEVEDEGPGIAIDDTSRIFDNFYDPEVNLIQCVSGAGIGLTVCQKLVDLQGGKIGVKAAQNGGSVFWFELPTEQPTELDLALMSRQANICPKVPIAILLVDDDSINLMIAELQIKKSWPAAVITSVSSAQQATALLADHNYDLLLTDMMMPGMNGLELTEWIRNHQSVEVAQMPVLGTTASANPSDWERCQQAGMNGVIVKPLEQSELVRTIRSHVRLNDRKYS